MKQMLDLHQGPLHIKVQIWQHSNIKTQSKVWSCHQLSKHVNLWEKRPASPSSFQSTWIHHILKGVDYYSKQTLVSNKLPNSNLWTCEGGKWLVLPTATKLSVQDTYWNPACSLVCSLACLSYSSRSECKRLAASRLAGLSVFGSSSKQLTAPIKTSAEYLEPEFKTWEGWVTCWNVHNVTAHYVMLSISLFSTTLVWTVLQSRNSNIQLVATWSVVACLVPITFYVYVLHISSCTLLKSILWLQLVYQNLYFRLKQWSQSCKCLIHTIWQRQCVKMPL